MVYLMGDLADGGNSPFVDLVAGGKHGPVVFVSINLKSITLVSEKIAGLEREVFGGDYANYQFLYYLLSYQKND
jgi:hypothetical protein